MKVSFWGVRGSIPTTRRDCLGYGGNTSCIEVSREGGRSLVLDCGTGARDLGERLVEQQVSEVDVLLSHLHIDHLMALPFFAPAHDPRVRLSITVPAFSADEALEKLTRYLGGPLHPVRLDYMASEVRIDATRPGEVLDRAGFEVRSCALNHPGGSLSYRVSADGRSFAYVTDTAPLAPHGTGLSGGEAPTPAEQRLIEHVRDADLVVFDTMFSRDEYLERMSWGHAYPEYALQICEAAGVKRLGLFHHLPTATDDRLDALGEYWKQQDTPVEVFVSREGLTLDLGHP